MVLENLSSEVSWAMLNLPRGRMGDEPENGDETEYLRGK
jgi:hypothetical protein